MKLLPSLLLTCLVGVSLSATADDTSQRAADIIKEMEDLYRGESSKGSLTMRIETPQYERTLELTTRNMGEDAAFIRILAPRKDRGIATLRLEKEMWNFFPKINKVIKVPPSMMMGSWMGSDFTNDDLVQQTELTEEYELSLIETEAHYEITLTPREDTVTVWGKIEYVIDRKRMIPVREVFYDEDGTMVRRLEFKDIREFDGRLLPSTLEMIPLNKENHRTVVTYESLQFDPDDVSDEDFTLRALKSRF